MSSTAIAPAADTAPAPRVSPEMLAQARETIRGFVQLQTLAQAREFADILCKTDLVPKDYAGKPGNAIVAMQMGMEIGLPPLQAIQSIAVVNGRPALWGDGLRALILSAPDLKDLKEDDDGETATCSIWRGDRSPVTRTFSMADAKLAGLAGGNVWGKYPKRMRQNRAFALAARDAYADRLRGIASAEEQEDVERSAAPAPSEPRRVGEGKVAAGETVAAPVDNGGDRRGPADQGGSTPPASTTSNTAGDLVERGVSIKNVLYIAAQGDKAERWEVDTTKSTYYVLSEPLSKEFDSCAGSDARFAITYKLVKSSKGLARVASMLTLDEEGGAA